MPAPLNDKSLDQIGLIHGTDKASDRHNYLNIYERFVAHLRYKPIRVLEIGVLTGASLRMWRDYFPQGQIVGVDIKEKVRIYSENRINIEIADQSDIGRLTEIAQKHGLFDLIVEDGSHIWAHQIIAIRTLIPFVRPGGIYIAEDLHTSYGDRPVNYGAGGGETGASFVLRMAERVLLPHKPLPVGENDPFLLSVAKNIETITFVRKSAIIRKM